ncbi:hypothetical protein [Microvirga calopogonii]|uniref:hypothetical protein n=1 Tax=Microvirga calopogonii TaxID=2078013 RepID=UPI0013B3A07E|nr:hypothetical protein [Microvirga calopogonii]
MSIQLHDWLSTLGQLPPVRVVEVDNDQLSASSAWMRDGFLHAVDGRTRKYFAVYKAKSGQHAKWLAAADGAALEVIPLAVEGGDCIVGGDFWLVGVNSVGSTMNIEGRQCDYQTAKQRISKLDTRKLHVVGYRATNLKNKFRWLRYKFRDLFRGPTASDPIFLFPSSVTQTGKWSTFFDMLLGIQGGDRLWQEWAHIDLVVAVTGRKDAKSGKDILVVASTTVHPCVPNREAEVQGDCLDALETYLSQSGFQIIRNPAPYSSQFGVVLPYNNVIVQDDPATVWLPQFGDAGDYQATDQANVELWRKIGFKVVPVPGWGAFLRDHASIRCATNGVARL